MNEREHKRSGRGRRRRGRDHKPALDPLTRPRKLDLDRAPEEALTAEEAKEMSEHLAFLRQFKAHLRLSFNAAEDLMINGARPPSDRGLCKYLLSKIDRKLVETSLARESMKDPNLRARFLAGVVRISHELSVLLWYLEALAVVADKREAAAAFAFTIDRIDFQTISQTQIASLLEVMTRTFEGHDRVQALFGLLSSESFAAALDRALPKLSPEHRRVFAPLRAVHRVVFAGERAPIDETERRTLEAGIALILDAPDVVLRSHPLEVRSRLAELVVRDPSLAGGQVPKALLDSLPHKGELYGDLALGRAEQLLAAKDDAGARALLTEIVRTHPDQRAARRRLDAMSWTRVGRLAVEPGSGRLSRAFWLETSLFVWARIAPKEHARALLAEAQIQEGTHLAGLVPALGRGESEDGSAWVALAPGGQPLERDRMSRLPLHDALAFTLEGLLILRTMATAGLQLPDGSPSRFLAERSPRTLRLADLAGVVRADPNAAAIAHGPVGAELATKLLSGEGGLRDDLPGPVAERLKSVAPLPVLVRALVREVARRE